MLADDPQFHHGQLRAHSRLQRRRPLVAPVNPAWPYLRQVTAPTEMRPLNM